MIGGLYIATYDFLLKILRLKTYYSTAFYFLLMTFYSKKT